MPPSISGSNLTLEGQVLGTLGYMPPEQILTPSTVDGRADVYALGAVLFHMLTLEPLHGSGSAQDRMVSTQRGADARASQRAPDRDIPPELDAICVKATALDPGDRYPSARALHDAIGAFLEGDRDTRLRSELAAHHVENARRAVARMMEDGPDAADQRKRALREAGRALALDPTGQPASGIVARLMLEPPKEMPAELRTTSDATLRAEMRRSVRVASIALACVTAIGSVLLFTGAIRAWTGVLTVLFALLASVSYGLYVSRSQAHHARHHSLVAAVPFCIAIAGISGILGPMLVGPTLALAFAAVISVAGWLGRYRIAIIALACASWAVPSILEWAGWLPPAYRFDDDGMTILPQLVDLPAWIVRPGLFVFNLAAILGVSALLSRYSRRLSDIRERQELHAWHLENIAPTEVRVCDVEPAPSPANRWDEP